MDPHSCRDEPELTEAGDIHKLGISPIAWILFAAAAFFAGTIVADGAHPAMGITFRATTKRVVDGDGIIVTACYPITIRMKDCWAPEIRGPEKVDGLKSKAHLEKLVPVGTPVIVSIDSEDARNMGDLLSFSRVVAEVWRDGDDDSLSEIMVDANFATAEKSRP